MEELLSPGYRANCPTHGLSLATFGNECLYCWYSAELDEVADKLRHRCQSDRKVRGLGITWSDAFDIIFNERTLLLDQMGSLNEKLQDAKKQIANLERLNKVAEDQVRQKQEELASHGREIGRLRKKLDAAKDGSLPDLVDLEPDDSAENPLRNAQRSVVMNVRDRARGNPHDDQYEYEPRKFVDRPEQ
jgi:hypothetical protein